MRAQHDRAIQLGEMLLARADQLRDLMALVVGWRCLGSTLFTLGDFVRARDHLDRAVALGQQSTTEDSALTYAVDPRIAAQLLLAWDLWILGYPDQALQNVLQAQLRAKQGGSLIRLHLPITSPPPCSCWGGKRRPRLQAPNKAWRYRGSITSACTLFIRGSGGAARWRACDNWSPRWRRSREESKRRAASISDTCVGSCSAGWQPLRRGAESR